MSLAQRYTELTDQLAELGSGDVRLLAVSKKKSGAEIGELADLGQRAFGENYLQEAVSKIQALADRHLEWHFIGRLQSNKCADVARYFDWCQSVDRERLVNALSRGRSEQQSPLQILLQTNIDGEVGKGGATPEQLPELADAVARAPGLELRGLMAIPEPSPDLDQRAAAFRALADVYKQLRKQHAQIDTLSMGMSADYASAIAQGSTMIRVGTALFGARDTLNNSRDRDGV